MSKTKKTPNETTETDVGYGRPPVHSRFKPGQSGNPKGRPKGVRNFKTDVKEMLKTSVKATRDGKPRSISTQQAALLRLREKALGGDVRALDQVIKLAQSHNNDDLTSSAGLAADDHAALEVFKDRLLSGAAAVESGKTPEATASASKPTKAPHQNAAKAARLPRMRLDADKRGED